MFMKPTIIKELAAVIFEYKIIIPLAEIKIAV